MNWFVGLWLWSLFASHTHSQDSSNSSSFPEIRITSKDIRTVAIWLTILILVIVGGKLLIEWLTSLFQLDPLFRSIFPMMGLGLFLAVTMALLLSKLDTKDGEK